MEEKTNAQQNEDIEIIEEDSKVDEKIRKLKKELETCKTEKEDYLKGWQRAKADYINLDKSFLEREKRVEASSLENVFRELLGLADSFELALASVPDSKWASGVRQTYEKLKSIMKARGVGEVESLGKKFDPAVHEAVELANTQNIDEDDLIISELQKGYTLKGRVLRPSRVRVAHYKVKE